jgi:hypothetical protein
MADSDLQAEPPRPHGPRRRRIVRDEDEDEDYVEDETDATGGLIPYKNPLALIGYYAGVFSLIPVFGLLLGPAALVLGILGLRYSSRHPTARGGGHAITGIVLGSLTSLVNWGIAAVLVVLSVVG